MNDFYDDHLYEEMKDDVATGHATEAQVEKWNRERAKAKAAVNANQVCNENGKGDSHE